MNVLDPAKAKHVFRLFSYGHGIRESARLAGVNRNTVTKYRREWLRVRSRLQEAYDAMWEHQCEKCDAITETLPENPVCTMLDAWMEDQFDEMPKSGFYHGYEDSPHATEAPAGQDENTKPGQVQGEPQEPQREDGRMTTIPPCIVCGKELESIWGDAFAQNQPDDATAFKSYGHYGSTAFDPMDGTFLAINVCDDCLVKAGEKGAVMTGGVPRPPEPKPLTPWRPDARRTDPEQER